MVQFSTPAIAAGLYPYLMGLLPGRGEVIEEMEAFAGEHGFPIVGPLVGRLLLQQALVSKASRVLELGSGFGYSAAWFTQAPGVRVVCTDGSPEHRDLAEGYLGRLGVWDRVDFHVGRAQELIADDPGPYDIVFCDIDKDGYPEALELALPRLRSGGLLIFDNVIWSGYAWAPLPEDAPEYRRRMTPGVRRVNELMFAHPELLPVIVPIRDGVALCYKA
jgi:caffeoyl-CoA O-methyltransferase